MTDYIKREDAMAEFATNGSATVYGIDKCKAIISRLKLVPSADVVEVGKEYLFKDGYQVIASTEGYFAIERVDSKYDNSELVLKRDGKFDCWNC